MTLLARHIIVLLFALGLASPALAKPDPVLLVSLDGFRADFLSRGVTPVLSQLAKGGVQAAMRPAFPSETFPNHYTLVTGLYPDHHGIIDNTMDDPVLGHFTMATTDPRWWDEAEPLWISADRQGLKTASMFWPGSDRAIRGARPDFWKPYDKSFLADDRVDQVLAWLDLPQDQRPSFITFYLDLVDTVAHREGPDSPATNDALRSTDASMGRLIEGLKGRGLLDHINIIVVADHGMAATSEQGLVYLDDIVDAKAIHTVTAGAVSELSMTPEAAPGAEAKLLALRRHARCWRKAALPAALHYGANPRVPPIVCIAEVGWYITTHARVEAMKTPLNKGSHGYDPKSPLMAALFIAHGPAFKAGVTLKRFDNVDVQPLMAQLLGIPVPRGDGTASVFVPARAPH
jgi:predicted AlkP superfamily pyrophosphatase or phosphodiesterase